MEPYVQEYLQKHQIAYQEHPHPPVFTVEEARIHCKNIPGLHCKNLFLRDKKKNFYLITVPAEKQINIRTLQKLLGVKKLGFASPEDLQAILKLKPGSVSPLGLINDNEKKVIFIVDQEVWDEKVVGFHPNVNTATLEMDKENFQRLINSFPHKVRIMNLE